MSNTALIHGPLPETNYLYKNVVVKGNFPLASLLVHPDTKYTIKHNFDLEGQTIELPPNCILAIDGGMLYNGTLVGDDSILIDVNRLGNVLDNVIQTGTWKKQDVLNSLSIGTVISGDEPQVTITGEDGDAILNFVLPKGDKGDQGDIGNPFTYEDFTLEQLEGLVGPQGPLGKAFEYSDFTQELLESIRGPLGILGPKGVSILSFTKIGELENDLIYNTTFDDGSVQIVNIPKGEKGDQGPQGDCLILDLSTSNSYTLYNVTGQNTDGAMTQKAVTDSLTSENISYNNILSSLAADNVQRALDEMSENIDDIGEDVKEEYTSQVVTTWTSGYINSSGEVSTSTAGKYSSYIEIDHNATYYKVHSRQSNLWYAAFYDSSKTKIGNAQVMPNSPSTEVDVTLNIPSAAVYMRVTVSQPYGGYIEVTKEGWIPKAITNHEERIGILEGKCDAIEPLLSAPKKTVIETEWTSGYIKSNGQVGTSTVAEFSGRIEIEEGATYSVYSILSSAWYIAFYNSTPELISTRVYPNGYEGNPTEYQITNIPVNTKFMRVTKSIREGYCVYKTADALIEKPVQEYLDELEQKIESSGAKEYCGIPQIGFRRNPTMFNADLMYIPMYGQSYTGATDGGYKVTDYTYDSNVYCHATPRPFGKGDTTLRHLSSTTEDTISAIGDTLSRLIKRFTGIQTQDILVGSYGQGSRSVMELSKDNSYGSGYHAYEDIFEPGVANAVAAAQANNKTINCPFIVYLQGESDIVSTRTTAATDDSWCKGDKSLYKQYMLQLKIDMQQTVMEATGQTEPPMVFVYTAGNTEFKSKANGIQQAVLELCKENSDMFCIGGYYFMTSMGAHLSPDGRRWLGEMFARHIFEVMFWGEDAVMRIDDIQVDGKNILLSVKTPCEPIVVDTHTYPSRQNYGFALYKNVEDTLVSIGFTDIVIGNNSIVLKTNETLSNMSLLLTYGNSSMNGGGNIRDNGQWYSYNDYKSNNNGTGSIVYIPLDENGNSYIGKPYPMQAWMPQFGISIEV